MKNDSFRSYCFARAAILLAVAPLSVGCFYKAYEIDNSLGAGGAGAGGAGAGGGTPGSGGGAPGCPAVGDFVPIACDQNSPTSIAVDGENVYWANQDGGEIMAWSKALGTVAPLVTGESKPCGIAAAEGYVYWRTRGGELKRVGVKDPAKKVYPIESDLGDHCAIASDGTSLVYAKKNVMNGYDILKRLTGGAPGIPITSSPDPTTFSVAGEFVVWVDGTEAKAYRARLTVPFDRQEFNVSKPCDASAVATRAFVSSRMDGTINAFLLSTGAAGEKVSGQSNPCRIAGSGDTLFWIDAAEGTVSSLSLLKAGQPTVHGKGPSGACAIAADTLGVYWTSCEANGNVMRLYK